MLSGPRKGPRARTGHGCLHAWDYIVRSIYSTRSISGVSRVFGFEWRSANLPDYVRIRICLELRMLPLY